MPAGFLRQLLEQIPILREPEVFSDAILAPEYDHVASQLLLSLPGNDFGHVGSGLVGAPLRRVGARFERLGYKRNIGRRTAGADDVSFNGGVRNRPEAFVAHFRA